MKLCCGITLELYLAGLKALGVTAQRCLAVEDSARGLAAARAAGIPCLVVLTDLTRKLDFAGALAVEPDVSAVLKHVQSGRVVRPGPPSGVVSLPEFGPLPPSRRSGTERPTGV